VSSFSRRHNLSSGTAGRWSKDEEDELIRVVAEINDEFGGGSGDNSNVSWVTVSERMNHTRGRQQCQAKWLVIPISKFLVSSNLTQSGWSYSGVHAIAARILTGVKNMLTCSWTGILCKAILQCDPSLSSGFMT
jgi:Myb-like DNA-binding domain